MSKSSTGVLVGGLLLVPVVVVALPLIALVALMGGSQSSGCTQQGVGGPGTGALSVGGIPAEFVPLIQAAGALSPAFPAPVLAAQIKQEGNFQKHGANGANASGYTQFIPETWAAYGKDTTGKGYADSNNASDAVDAQARYDRDLANQVIEAQRDGRLPASASSSVTELALAGYNAGFGAVLAHGGIPPYAETQAYVPRIMAMARGEFSQAGTVDAADAAPSAVAPDDSAAAGVGCGGSLVQVRVLNLTYPNSTGAQLPADVYLPPGGGAGTTPLRPILVMVHGGGWFFGDRHEYDDTARKAAQHGYIAVTFEYDMSAPGRWPREVNDVRAAIEWARSQAPQWGGDPGKIATWGTSAGANLAVDVAAAGDHSGLSAAVGWSGPYLLQALPQQASTPEQQIAATADPFIYLDCLIQFCPEKYAAASPAVSATPTMPPTYLANSSNELVPMGQQDAMVATLQRLGVPHEAVVVPGTAHAIGYAAQQTAPTLAWLDKTLGFTPPPPPTVGGSGGGGPAQQKVVESARTQLGIGLPYIWGGGGYNGPTGGGFDCSGLTAYAFHQVGLDLPRTAQTQYAATADTMLPGGFTPEAYQPGDLLFWGTPGDIHHVAIAIGNGQLIQASTFGEPLNIKPIYNGDFFAATRPLK